MAKLPDSKTIKELAELLNETGLSEIEVEVGNMRVKVARQLGGAVVATSSPAVAAAPAPVAAEESSASPATPASAASPATMGEPVRSPMVGTAYLAPEPGAADFVSLGGQVKEGDTLLIVEAMKTMNPITAPKSGKLVEIAINNEQTVEFDQLLMIIE